MRHPVRNFHSNVAARNARLVSEARGTASCRQTDQLLLEESITLRLWLEHLELQLPPASTVPSHVIRGSFLTLIATEVLEPNRGFRRFEGFVS
jgi:hypothetical protein